MRVILVSVSLIVAVAGRPGHAENFIPLASVSSEGPRQAGGPGVEERATSWLTLTRGTRLLSSDASTVTVDTGGGPHRFSRDQLFHLQYRAGGRDREKGAAIGAAITGLAGLVAGVVMVANEYDESRGCDQCGIFVGLIAFAAAIPGGAIGFAIGAPGGEWRNSSPDGLTVTGAAAPRRATVALRLRLGRR
jgi:hypothetical protein